MVGAALQRFAILVMLLGGIIELGSGGNGIGFMIFATIIGIAGLIDEL